MSYQEQKRVLVHQQSSCSWCEEKKDEGDIDKEIIDGNYTGHICEHHKADAEILNPDFSCPTRKATLLSSTFNLVATIIGGGVLSLPLAFQKCGIGLATIMMILSALITDFSLYILCSCARRTGSQSYGEVARSIFGDAMDLFTTFLLFVYLMFVIVAFMVLVRGIWTPILLEIGSLFRPTDTEQNKIYHSIDDTTLTETYGDWFLLAIIVTMSPFLLKKDLYALRYNCYVGFTSITFLAIAIIYRAVERHMSSSSPSKPEQSFEILWFTDNFADALYAFPLITLAFLCVFNINQIQNSIVQPTRKRLRTVIHSAVAVCFVLMYIFGVAGYLYSGDNTKDNILLNFNVSDKLILLGRMGCGTNLMLNLAIVTLPCRDSMLEIWPQFIELWRKKRNAYNQVDSNHEYSSTDTDSIDPETNATLSNTKDNAICEDTPLILGIDDSIPGAKSKRSKFCGSSEESGRYLGTLLIASTCYIAAVYAPGVGIVWSVCGSSMAFIIAFILPCACYIKLRCRKVGHGNYRIIASWFLLVFSVVGAIACTVQTIWRIFFK
jgi:amino acid permease